MKKQSNIIRLFLAATLLLSTAGTVWGMELPEGWTSVMRDDVLVVTRSYPEGEMTIHLSPWQIPNSTDVRDWLEARTTAPSKFIPVINAEREVLPSNIDNAYYILRDLRPLRGRQRNSLLLACGMSGQVRLVDAFGISSLFSGDNPAILADAAQIAKIACAAPPEPLQRLTTRPDFKRPPAPPGLEGVWYLADFVVGINGYEVRQWSVVTFSDNTVTDDVQTIFSQGIAASKRQNPNSWGNWQLVDGDLEIKWNRSSYYSDYFLTIKERAGGSDERIDGCFSSSFGYTLGGGGSAFGGGSTSISINTWCFAENGQFSNDNMVAINGGTGPSSSGETVFSGSSSSDSVGWYRIDGHVIQLVYANGISLTTSFALGDEGKRLLLNGRHYD